MSASHSGNADDLEIKHALEPFPLEESVWKMLNYDAWVDRKMFTAVHESEGVSAAI